MQSSANLFGLVLSGGQSTRMGQDKGLLHYYGQTQRLHAYRLLQKVCSRVFLSLRPGQESALEANIEFLLDNQPFRGPINGILSALQQHPNTAFLVMACDLPLVIESTVLKLVRERDTSYLATAYAAECSSLPEPLLAIWEPTAYLPALAFAQEGKFCPRKFLLQNPTTLIYPAQPDEIFNANHPEEFRYAKNQLRHGNQV
jgi:molybdenum cofactor guanylyltransferase